MPNRILRKLGSSMSAKVAVIVVLPVALVMMFQSFHDYQKSKQQLFQNTEMQMLRIAENLKASVELFLGEKDFMQLQTLIREAAKGAEVELIALYDDGEKVVASNKTKWLGKTASDMHPEDVTDHDIAAIKKGLAGGYSIYFDSDDAQYCLVMPVAYGSAAVAALHVSLDVGSLMAAVERDATERVLFSILIVAIIGASIYFLFHYFFTRRIQSVSTAAARLGTGDMNARAGDKGTDEIGYLAASFNVLAEEIANWRSNLEQMVVDRVKDLSILYEVVDAINKSLELGKVLPSVLDRLLENMGEGKGVVALVGDEGAALKLIAHKGLTPDGLRHISQHGHGCAGDVILKNNPIRIAGLKGDMQGIPGLEQDNIRSALAVPISVRGAVLGVIALYSEKKERFTEQDEALLSTIGSQVGVAVENARLYEKTLELAQVDGLTGLANRRHLMDTLKREVERSSRYTAPLTVIVMDLDKFKIFNDAYGHLRGDELLRGFASVVKNSIRLTDSPGRYGGEEFVVVLPNTPLKGAIITAERIRKATEELKIPIDEQTLAGTTVSIGIAELMQGETEEKLFATADSALYRAKQEGRNRVAW